MDIIAFVFKYVQNELILNGWKGLLTLEILLLVMIAVSYQIVLILHEGGHAVFGILTGYQITLFRIGIISLVHEEGRVSVKFYHAYASSGQCILCPPNVENGANVPFVLPTLGGIIGNVILCGISAVPLLFSSNRHPFIRIFFCILFITSLLNVLLNGIPGNSAINSNDGLNFKLLNNNAQTRRSLYCQLHIINKLCRGVTYKELAEEMVTVPRPSDYTNPIMVWHQMVTYYRFLDNDRWTDAYEYLIEIEKHSGSCPKILKKSVQAERLFLMIKFNFASNEIEELYEQIKKQIKNKNNDFHLVKVRMAYELYKKDSPRIRERIQSELKVKSNTYPYKGETLLCIKLVNGMMI